MSRSRLKTPIAGIAICRSERADKQEWHRRFRKRVREVLGSLDMASEPPLPHFRSLSDPWEFGKDGKHRISPSDHPRLLRK